MLFPKAISAPSPLNSCRKVSLFSFLILLQCYSPLVDGRVAGGLISPNQFISYGESYKVAKSFQSPSFSVNFFCGFGFHSEFVHKSSKNYFKWVKGFVFNPNKYEPAGPLGCIISQTLMVTVSPHWQKEGLRFRLVSLGGKISIFVDLLCVLQLKYARKGNDYLFVLDGAFNVIEWFIPLADSSNGSPNICLHVHYPYKRGA